MRDLLPSHPLRPSTATMFSAGIAASLAALAVSDASAQQTRQAPPRAPSDPQNANTNAVPLPDIIVDGEGERGDPNALRSTTGLGRLPGTIRDVPQTVNVINQKTMQQQGVTTLDQALKNVPGVTVSIGEGGGGNNGDQFRIRGFQAKGDIYTDGLRDFGVYVRDSFAYEQVDVIKGPASESFGAGTAGGAINSSLKNAKLGDAYSLEGSIGTGPLLRAVGDINKQINETTAVRLVGMIHDQDIVDRDHVYSDRYGFLGSVGFGLGTDKTWTISYLHQNGKRRPDMGLPVITPFAGVPGLPVTEFGVRRSTYLGKATDLDDSQTDMLTSRAKWEATDWLTLSNDTRIAAYRRLFQQGFGSCGNNLAALFCAQNVAAGNFNVPYAFGGPAGHTQESWGWQNITTAVAEFHTGSFRHEFIAGLDVNYQDNKRGGLTNVGTKIAGTIANPNFDASTYYVTDNFTWTKANSTNIGVFASDRVWLTSKFSVLAGGRWDHFEAESWNQTATGGLGVPTNTESSAFSPKASVIWEPTKTQTYYVSWAKSFSPVGQFVTNDSTVINANPVIQNLDPEETELWEVGAKVSFFDDRLGLTGAIFRVTKDSAFDIDPGTGLPVTFGDGSDTRRVQGIEVGVTGKVTDAWTVQLAYSFLDGENTRSTTAAAIGKDAPFVSPHSGSLWTTYNIAAHMPSIKGELLIGGGITYRDEYFINNTNTAKAPASFSVDGLISYEYDKFRIALTATNLTDELNYDAVSNNRAVVSAGRTFMLTAGVKW